MHTPNVRSFLPAVALALGVLVAGAAGAQPTRLPLPPPPMAAPPPRVQAPSDDAPAVGATPSADPTLHERQTRVAALIDQSLADGTITPAEARDARRRLTDIRQTEDRLRRRQQGVISETETFRLEGRLKDLAARVRHAT